MTKTLAPALVFLALHAFPAHANPILDLFFPPAKWNQQCKDLANDLISRNGIENVKTQDPQYLKKLKALTEKREEYRDLLNRQPTWKMLDSQIKELNQTVDRVIQREIDSLQKDAERLARRDNMRDKMRSEAAAAQIPGLKTLLGKKRRELAALSSKREAARITFNELPATKSLLNEIFALDGDTRGHWLFEQFSGRDGRVEVQAYSGSSPFYVYSDGGHFLGYRSVLPGDASLYVQLNSDCTVKEKGYSTGAQGAALINASLCNRRPEYAQLLRKYNANGQRSDLKRELIEFLEDSGSVVSDPADFAMPMVDRACRAMYPETEGVVPVGDPAAAAN